MMSLLEAKTLLNGFVAKDIHGMHLFIQELKDTDFVENVFLLGKAILALHKDSLR